MYKISKRKLVIILMAALSFVIAVWQPFGYSPDFTNYESFFEETRSYFSGMQYLSRFEPGFYYISVGLTQVLTSDLIVYGLFVFTSIFLKLNFGLREVVESYFWIAIVFYFFKYFPLHELTQLRAALAAAFLMPAFSYIERGSYWKGLFACLIAASFHYSALIVAPFLFLPRFDRRQAVIMAIVVFVVLFAASSYLIDVASANFEVFEMYGDFGDRLHPLNKFSPVFFPEFFIILFSLVFWQRLSE